MSASAPMTAKILLDNRKAVAGGAGSAPIIGSPETVARAIQDVSAAGFDGLTIAFVDFARELPYFIQEVLPRLEEFVSSDKSRNQ